jgi:hypothetical protein
MKYFFLSEGWQVGRVWESSGLWNRAAWRRLPEIERTNFCMVEQQEKLWLYRVEPEVLMLEIMPTPPADGDPQASSQGIGQVMIKRLMSADQVLAYFDSSEVLTSALRTPLSPPTLSP